MLLKPSVVGADSGSNRFNVEKEQSVPQCDGGGIGRRHFLMIVMSAAGNNDVRACKMLQDGKEKIKAGCRVSDGGKPRAEMTIG